jgi:hypothetical protein
MTDQRKSNVPLVESLVDCIGSLHGIQHPGSMAYQLRSPLLIKSFAKPGKHVVDADGRRIFPSLLSGYKAAVYDMELKVRGQSRAGLKPTDGLRNLLGVYGIKELVEVDKAVTFLRHALGDMTIHRDTPLSYFIEEAKKATEQYGN